jgi:hypothetical protein
MTCKTCAKTIDALEAFPGGICVDCYAATPAGQAPVTAEQLTAMWGGPVTKTITWEDQ